MNYYNEYDPNAAAWLRELVAYGAIPNGHVDTRSIRDVQPSDLSGYTQCHFFAGIGGWSYALRLANWDPARPVWTGSCPCQPFSTAGKRRGTADERHLWPEFFRLIRECRPATIFGEQVASPVALDWLDAVSTDLEGAGYAFGAADLCAAGIGAPHIRQRLYWVADANGKQAVTANAGGFYAESGGSGVAGGVADAMHAGRPERRPEPGCGSASGSSRAGGMGHSVKPGLERHREGSGSAIRRDGAVRPVAEAGESCGLADAEHPERRTVCGSVENGHHGAHGRRAETHCQSRTCGEVCFASPTNTFWGNPDWLLCRDGKWRPVESGTFPLAHGVPGRVGLLRGYGNAIVPQIAAEFIKAAVQD